MLIHQLLVDFVFGLLLILLRYPFLYQTRLCENGLKRSTKKLGVLGLKIILLEFTDYSPTYRIRGHPFPARL